MKHTNFLFLLCFLPSIMAFSQSASLSGKVIDAESKEPVLYGAVVLYQNGVIKEGTETDFDGNYNFGNLDPGIYVVEANYLGYQTNRVTEVYVFAGKAIIVHVELSQESILSGAGTMMKEYHAPNLQEGNTIQETALTSEQIRNLPIREINGYRSSSSAPARNRKNQLLTPKSMELSTRTENNSSLIDQATFFTTAIDVDQTAYSIVQKYFQYSHLPPFDTVSVEKPINYLDYGYPQQSSGIPCSTSSELNACPLNVDTCYSQRLMP